MYNQNEPSKEKEEFGPLLARIYAFFASKSGKHRLVYSRITEDVTSLHPSSILEIGSGPGIAAAMIAGKLPDTRILCVDPSTTMTKIANRRFEKLSLTPRVKCILGDSSNIKTEELFDLIYTSLSFHHWSDGKRDLLELGKKLVPNGTLIIYENFISDNGNNKKVKHQHGIGLRDIESFEIPGFVKKHTIHDGLVTVKFNKIEIV